MHSRILQYKNNVSNYDLLTQFSIKNYNNVPSFSSFSIKIGNIKTNDVKQVCLNSIVIQLVGNNYITLKSIKNVFVLNLTGNDIYFALENLSLLAYKNQIKNVNLNKLTVKSTNFLTFVEYFTLNSNFLKFLEKTFNKNLNIFFSYQINNDKNRNTVLYLIKSLNLPFF